MAKKVFISVGHGGADSGAVGINGIKEKDVNLAISLECAKVLQRHGVDVLMSRTKDENDKTKVKECNAFLGADGIAVDIHNNAGNGDGCEVYYYSKGGKSLTLAQHIVSEIAAIGQNLRKGSSGQNDGLKYRKNVLGGEYYAFIRETVAPAVIVECAFLDNKTDVQIIDTEAEQKAFGIAIARGILKALNITFVEEKPVATEPETNGKLYRVQVGAYKVKANAVAMQKKLKDAGFNAIIV